MLSAVVLAAGESKRMGGHIKALLPVQGTTFLQKIMVCLTRGDVDEVFVVLGARCDLILERIQPGRAKVLINEQWESGQLSSLRLGIQNLSPRSEGVLFTPVDHPCVLESTYETLIAAWKESRNNIVVPTYNGRKGHPTIFPMRYYGSLLHDELPHGARDILYREREAVVHVPVHDPGVVQDVDSPEDYRRIIGELP